MFAINYAIIHTSNDVINIIRAPQKIDTKCNTALNEKENCENIASRF